MKDKLWNGHWKYLKVKKLWQISRDTLVRSGGEVQEIKIKKRISKQYFTYMRVAGLFKIILRYILYYVIKSNWSSAYIRLWGELLLPKFK